MQPAPDSTEKLASKLAASIYQIGDPYRARLIAWLRMQIGQDLSDVEKGLRVWLNSLDMDNRADHLHLATIQMVIETTCQVFGDKNV